MSCPAPAGFDPLAEPAWTIRWDRRRIEFLVDGALLPATTAHVPRGPMQANIIAWPPASTWPVAYSRSLQPPRSASANVRHVA